MVDALLLEWEGVLADTRVARQGALAHALAAEGIELSTAACAECAHGRSAHAAAAAAVSQAGISDHTVAGLVGLRAEQAFRAALSGGILLTPGAAPFVELAQRFARVAIVTRAARAETELVLRLSGLDAAIVTIITCDDAAGDAPSPALYRQALTRLASIRSIAAGGVIAVADAARCFHAARAAGLRSLAVGAPAHEAMEANAAVTSLEGLTMAEIARLIVPARAEPLA